MNSLFVSIRIFFVLSLLTGVVYPFTVTGLAQLFFNHKANGSLISKNGDVIGSSLIAQKFESPKYFHPRPSAIDFNALPSGGTNLAPNSKKLKESIEAHQQKWGDQAPRELLTTSASGVDPHVTPESARFQLERVARARGFDAGQVDSLKKLLERMTDRRTLGFIGEERINVLELNLNLDQL